MQSNRLAVRGSVFVVDERYYCSRNLAPLIRIDDLSSIQQVTERFEYQSMAFNYNNPVLGRQVSMSNKHALGTGNFVANVGIIRDTAMELSFVSPIIQGMRRLAIDPYGQMKSDVLTNQNTVKIQAKNEPQGNSLQSILPDIPKLGTPKNDTPLGVLLSTLFLHDPDGALDPFEVSSPGLCRCLASEALSAEEIDDADAPVAVIHSSHLFSYLLGTVAQACGIERIYSFRWPIVDKDDNSVIQEQQPYLLVMPMEIARKLVAETKRLRGAVRANLVDSDKASLQLYRAVYHDSDSNSTVTRTCLVNAQDGSVEEIQNQRSLPFQIKFVVTYARPVQCRDMIVHGSALPPPIFEDSRKLTLYSCLLDRENRRVLTCPDSQGDVSKKRRHEMVSAAYHRAEPKSTEDFNSKLDSILIDCMRSTTTSV